MRDRDGTPNLNILGTRKTLLAASVVAAMGSMHQAYESMPRHPAKLKPVDPDKKAKRTAQGKARAVTRKGKR